MAFIFEVKLILADALTVNKYFLHGHLILCERACFI